MVCCTTMWPFGRSSVRRSGRASRATASTTPLSRTSTRQRGMETDGPRMAVARMATDPSHTPAREVGLWDPSDSQTLQMALKTGSSLTASAVRQNAFRMLPTSSLRWCRTRRRGQRTRPSWKPCGGRLRSASFSSRRPRQVVPCSGPSEHNSSNSLHVLFAFPWPSQAAPFFGPDLYSDLLLEEDFVFMSRQQLCYSRSQWSSSPSTSR
mmetsp:Transcript_5335/g.13789  ORF Transcript_5335/g.13789 Transcript_5335/m.13789 type:complete len:209 (+) Transcript_5335:144-770(+)